MSIMLNPWHEEKEPDGSILIMNEGVAKFTAKLDPSKHWELRPIDGDNVVMRHQFLNDIFCAIESNAVSC